MAKSCLTGVGGGHVTSSAREARIAHEVLPRVYEVFPHDPCESGYTGCLAASVSLDLGDYVRRMRCFVESTWYQVRSIIISGDKALEFDGGNKGGGLGIVLRVRSKSLP